MEVVLAIMLLPAILMSTWFVIGLIQMARMMLTPGGRR